MALNFLPRAATIERKTCPSCNKDIFPRTNGAPPHECGEFIECKEWLEIYEEVHCRIGCPCWKTGEFVWDPECRAHHLKVKELK